MHTVGSRVLPQLVAAYLGRWAAILRSHDFNGCGKARKDKAMKLGTRLIVKHWRTILEFVGLLGLIVALMQLSLQQQQFIYEISQKANLEYSYQFTLTATDQRAITLAANELTGSFYERLYQERRSNPNVNFSTTIESLLPMTSTITARPFSILSTVRNRGQATATAVHVIVEMNRPITALEVDSLEPYRIVKGALGDNAIIIEIDRIVAGQATNIVFRSDTAIRMEQLDQVVLTKRTPIQVEIKTRARDNGRSALSVNTLFNNFLIQSDNFLIDTPAGTWGYLDQRYGTLIAHTPYFPEIWYLSAEQPSVDISVTSNEGPATLAATISP